jgi:hypothetical protein
MQRASMAQARNLDLSGATLLTVGLGSTTSQVADVVIKISRTDEEAEATQEDAKAVAIEVDFYKILGHHARIVNCLCISPSRDMVILEYYRHGNLRADAADHGPARVRTWQSK